MRAKDHGIMGIKGQVKGFTLGKDPSSKTWRKRKELVIGKIQNG